MHLAKHGLFPAKYQEWSLSKSISLGISIYKVILLEFQRPLSHPVSDQGDWRAQPGGGGDGHQVQNGGAGGLDQGSHEQEQDDVICFSCDRLIDSNILFLTHYQKINNFAAFLKQKTKKYSEPINLQTKAEKFVCMKHPSNRFNHIIIFHKNIKLYIPSTYLHNKQSLVFLFRYSLFAIGWIQGDP